VVLFHFLLLNRVVRGDQVHKVDFAYIKKNSSVCGRELWRVLAERVKLVARVIGITKAAVGGLTARVNVGWTRATKLNHFRTQF
tara:strand:- start:35 stop:286 length:252 start_codon:yes stop_codon:yes gene_type:complete